MASNLSLLPEALAEKARTNLSEIPSERGEQIETLRRKILSHPEMMNFRTDDAFLLRFLRAKKFDQERAFQNIKNYYKQRQHYAEFIKDLYASNYSHVLSTNYNGVLPNRDDEGRPILVFNAPAWNLDVMSYNDITAILLLSLELLLEEDETQINGTVFIINMNGFTLSHILALYPSSMKKMFSLAYNCLPIMYKQVHFVNGSKLYDVMMTVMRPFLPKKLKERFIFHGHDLQAFHKYIKLENLPEEFGGTLGPFCNKEWVQKLLEHDAVMSENMKYGLTEK